MDEVRKGVKIGIGRMGVEILEEGREWRLPVDVGVLVCVASRRKT